MNFFCVVREICEAMAIRCDVMEMTGWVCGGRMYSISGTKGVLCACEGGEEVGGRTK
jgi:hypothetical protein